MQMKQDFYSYYNKIEYDRDYVKLMKHEYLQLYFGIHIRLRVDTLCILNIITCLTLNFN